MGLVDNLWKAIKDDVEYYQKRDKKLRFDDSKEDDFKLEFDNIYKSIKDKYMNKNVQALDRHKVAAVVIAVLLNMEVVSYSKVSSGKVFVGNEMIATEIALSWMLGSLNDKLSSLGIEKIINNYFMPKAFSCDTPYFDIFSRNLYFSRTEDKLNPLEIAEKLFLIEYITLLKNGIDPEKLIETV